MKVKQLPTEKQYIDLAISLKAIDAEKRTIKGIVASDGLIDRHGESLNPNGWKINGHVPLLWGHQYQDLPVGKTTNEYVENGQLIVDGRLSKKYAFAQDLFDLIEEEIVDKVSVGFIPLKWDDSGDYTFAEMELLEVSFVNVPANPRAGIKDFEAKIKSVEDGLKKLFEMTKENEPEKPEEKTTEPEKTEPEKTEPEQKTEPEKTEEPEEKTVTLKLSELKALIAEGVQEAMKKAEPEEQKTEEPAAKPILEQLVEMRDALRGNYTDTAEFLNSLNKTIKSLKSKE